MGNFYEGWLKSWDDEEEERRKARILIDEEELEWVRTKQDWRAALLCDREIGFVTSGSAMLAEIPGGWHTGKHSHGEEAIYILQGQGFSVLDGLRYDWETGSCLFMPYGSAHQHFNTGGETARYVSVTAFPLERFVGIAKILQHEEAGETATDEVAGIPPAPSELHPEYGRIVLKLKDAPVVTADEAGAYYSKREDEYTRSLPKEMRTAGIPWHRSRSVSLMSAPENKFKSREVFISSILCDEPGMHSGKHGHMEALLYVLQGEGYSIIDGKTVSWKRGTLLQVQGPQTVHQHFNTGKIESQQLRIHFGIRSDYFQKIVRRTFPYKYYEISSYGKK